MAKPEDLIRLYALRTVGELSERDVMAWGKEAVVNDDCVLPIALLAPTALASKR